MELLEIRANLMKKELRAKEDGAKDGRKFINNFIEKARKEKQ